MAIDGSMTPLLSQAAPSPSLQPLMAQTPLQGGGNLGPEAGKALQRFFFQLTIRIQWQTASLGGTQLLTSWGACFVLSKGQRLNYLYNEGATEGHPEASGSFHPMQRACSLVSCPTGGFWAGVSSGGNVVWL